MPNSRWNFPLRSARYDPIKRKGSIDRCKKERGGKKMYDTDHAGHDKSFRYLFSPIGRVTSPSCRHEVLPYYFVSLDLLLFRRVLKETRLYSLTRWSFSIPVWLVTRPERSQNCIFNNSLWNVPASILEKRNKVFRKRMEWESKEKISSNNVKRNEC